MAITVLLSDDHTIVREGLRLLLEAQKDIVVVGEAADGRETVRLAKQLHPDVVIMDIAMPEFNGIAATQRIKDSSPSVSVIILSMHASNEHIFRALQAGASGYLLKESAGTEVVRAVRAVAAGQRYLSGQIAETVIDYTAGNLTPARRRARWKASVSESVRSSILSSKGKRTQRSHTPSHYP